MSEPRRRDLLAQGGLVAALFASGWLGTREAAAADVGSGFEATSLEDALRSLGSTPASSDAIAFSVPGFVENGAFVPIVIESRVPGTEEIALLVESNPFPLVARFAIPAGTEPYIATRVKLAGSCRVFAVVRAGGRLYATSHEATVGVGGCG